MNVMSCDCKIAGASQKFRNMRSKPEATWISASAPGHV